MNISSKIVEDAVKSFSSLPGVGRKTALRLVLHLLNDKYDLADEMSLGLSKLKEVRFCKQCHNISDNDVCEICTSQARNRQTVCVVESIRDVIAIEETGYFSGLYHVLGGIISPLNGIGPENLNIRSLLERIERQGVEELIMAISPTIDGDTTIYYLTRMIPSHVKVSTIARGVAFGGELEYADEFTLGRSIASRVPYTVQNNQL
ncbi:MAG TPA: recombination mediator RecR [Saprospiraceae bacterium]|nr:recombination protein RecR [Saprospirales bacterium]HRQ31431.1 recombination mediator RecR [Saprospiraceae bacterium]